MNKSSSVCGSQRGPPHPGSSSSSATMTNGDSSAAGGSGSSSSKDAARADLTPATSPSKTSVASRQRPVRTFGTMQEAVDTMCWEALQAGYALREGPIARWQYIARHGLDGSKKGWSGVKQEADPDQADATADMSAVTGGADGDDADEERYSGPATAAGARTSAANAAAAAAAAVEGQFQISKDLLMVLRCRPLPEDAEGLYTGSMPRTSAAKSANAKGKARASPPPTVQGQPPDCRYTVVLRSTLLDAPGLGAAAARGGATAVDADGEDSNSSTLSEINSIEVFVHTHAEQCEMDLEDAKRRGDEEEEAAVPPADAPGNCAHGHFHALYERTPRAKANGKRKARADDEDDEEQEKVASSDAEESAAAAAAAAVAAERDKAAGAANSDAEDEEAEDDRVLPLAPHQERLVTQLVYQFLERKRRRFHARVALDTAADEAAARAAHIKAGGSGSGSSPGRRTANSATTPAADAARAAVETLAPVAGKEFNPAAVLELCPTPKPILPIVRDGLLKEEAGLCYCDMFEFGNMILCDGEHCPRQWYHWACVGLSNEQANKIDWDEEQWYCLFCAAGKPERAPRFANQVPPLAPKLPPLRKSVSFTTGANGRAGVSSQSAGAPIVRAYSQLGLSDPGVTEPEEEFTPEDVCDRILDRDQVHVFVDQVNMIITKARDKWRRRLKRLGEKDEFSRSRLSLAQKATAVTGKPPAPAAAHSPSAQARSGIGGRRLPSAANEKSEGNASLKLRARTKKVKQRRTDDTRYFSKDLDLTSAEKAAAAKPRATRTALGSAGYDEADAIQRAIQASLDEAAAASTDDASTSKDKHGPPAAPVKRKPGRPRKVQPVETSPEPEQAPTARTGRSRARNSLPDVEAPRQMSKKARESAADADDSEGTLADASTVSASASFRATGRHHHDLDGMTIDELRKLGKKNHHKRTCPCNLSSCEARRRVREFEMAEESTREQSVVSASSSSATATSTKRDEPSDPAPGKPRGRSWIKSWVADEQGVISTSGSEGPISAREAKRPRLIAETPVSNGSPMLEERIPSTADGASNPAKVGRTVELEDSFKELRELFKDDVDMTTDSVNLNGHAHPEPLVNGTAATAPSETRRVEPLSLLQRMGLMHEGERAQERIGDALRKFVDNVAGAVVPPLQEGQPPPPPGSNPLFANYERLLVDILNSIQPLKDFVS